MSLSEQDSKVLQEIVDTQGNCIDSKRCPLCPFRAMCLPEYLNKAPLSTQRRLSLALEILSHQWLIDAEITTTDIKEDYVGKMP